MKRVFEAALCAALALGAAACTDSPSGPADRYPIVPSGPPPLEPPVAPPSPLGQIVYVDNGLTLINVDGSGMVRLGYGLSPSWSPDGTRFIFSDTRCETDWETYYRCLSGGLHIMKPETREITTQPGGALGVEPAWSPTGDMIAFVRHDIPGRLFLMKLDGSESRQLSFPFIHDVFEPSWSPDGQRIAFQCLHGYGMGVCAVNRDGTGFARLTGNGYFAAAPAWSPNGSRIAFQFWNTQTDAGEVALMAPDGSGVSRVADGYSPVWSPDATKLVFSRRQGGLVISNADGSNVTILTASGHSPAWRP